MYLTRPIAYRWRLLSASLKRSLKRTRHPEHMASAYRVVYSGVVRNALVQLSARATQRGLSGPLLDTLRQIDRELHQDPVGFGDPWHKLPQAGLLVMDRVISPLQIMY